MNIYPILQLQKCEVIILTQLVFWPCWHFVNGFRCPKLSNRFKLLPNTPTHTNVWNLFAAYEWSLLSRLSLEKLEKININYRIVWPVQFQFNSPIKCLTFWNTVQYCKKNVVHMSDNSLQNRTRTRTRQIVWTEHMLFDWRSIFQLVSLQIWNHKHVSMNIVQWARDTLCI